MTEQWYCKIVGQEIGPVTSEDLAAMLDRGQIDRDDKVRDGTSGHWRLVKEVLGAVPERTLGQSETMAAASDDYGFLSDIAKLDDAEPESVIASRPSSDDLLAGFDDLDDAAEEPSMLPYTGRSADDLIAGLAGLEDAAPAVAVPDRSDRHAPPPAAPRERVPAVEPVPQPTGMRAASPPVAKPTPAASEPAPEASVAATSTSAATDVVRDMATAHLRAAQQASAKPAARPAFTPPSRSGSGGGGFDLSNLNVSGKQLGIGAVVVAVLALGYFGLNSGLLASFGAGAVYDETAKLYAEFKAVSDAGSMSQEFTSFYGNFQNKKQELLHDIGTPSHGSTAYDVKRAVLELATVVEAHRRPDMSETERQPYVDALDQRMNKLKQTFGR